MATIEVDLKEGDKEPEQHLDEGEHIERVVVPLNQLYEKLQGENTVARTLPFALANFCSLFEGGGQDCGCQVCNLLLGLHLLPG